jgi:hypothetical protein
VTAVDGQQQLLRLKTFFESLLDELYKPTGQAY